MDRWKVRAAAHSSALALLRSSPHRWSGRSTISPLGRRGLRAALPAIGTGVAATRDLIKTYPTNHSMNDALNQTPDQFEAAKTLNLAVVGAGPGGYAAAFL